MTGSSYYHARTPAPPPRPPLLGTVEAETGIVGGGLAGLATALSLAERGRAPMLIEARRIGAGASGRNGGMVSAGFAQPASHLERTLGPAAGELMTLSRDAIARLRACIARYGIACEPVEGVVVASCFDRAAALQAEAEALNERYGMGVHFWPRERLRAAYPSPRYFDGLFDPDGLHLDPLALCRGYAAAAEGQGARIFEDTPGMALERQGGRWRVQTPAGALLAERLVLCQSVYPPAFVPVVARASLAVCSYIIVTAPLEGRHARVIRAPYAVHDDRFATGYYRLLPDGRLLWGGGVGIRETPRDLAGLMRRDLARIYPQLADVAIEHAWSGRMGFARHKMPLIRELRPGLWINSLFGGHGLNTTTLGGELVAAALVEGDDRHRLFEPFAPRWVGGALASPAVQAIYGRHILADAVRAAWHRRRAGAWGKKGPDGGPPGHSKDQGG
jgi:gamma-glutamylputrescine oxidase